MPTGVIDTQALRQHIWLNRLQSLLLLAAMSAFLALFGWLLWGGDGIVMLLGVGIVGVLFNPTISPRLVMRLYGASRIGPDQVPALRTALSRTREYDADLNAALLTGDPEGLAGALAKIERVQGGWMERILMPGRRVPEPSLLRTHPETRERIARLMALKAPPTGVGEGVDAIPFGGTTLGEPIGRLPRWHVSGLWH
jgi:Zn-dependent protease with chaperone function